MMDSRRPSSLTVFAHAVGTGSSLRASCWCIEACQAGNAPKAVAVPVCAFPKILQDLPLSAPCRSTASSPSRRPASSTSSGSRHFSRDRSAARQRPARSPSSSPRRRSINRFAAHRRPARSLSSSRSRSRRSRDRSAARRRPARSPSSSPRRRSRDRSAARRSPARSLSSSRSRCSRDRSAPSRRPARNPSSSPRRRSRDRSAARRRPARSPSSNPRRHSKGCRLQSRECLRRFRLGWDGPVERGWHSWTPARRCPPGNVRGSPEYIPFSLGLDSGDPHDASKAAPLRSHLETAFTTPPAWPLVRRYSFLSGHQKQPHMLTLSQIGSNTGCALDCTLPKRSTGLLL